MRIILVWILLGTGLAAQSAEQPPGNPFLVRTSENWSTLNPTLGPNNFSNCLIVMPDGRIHLELRRQEFFDGRSAMTTYEPVLPTKEMELLKGILDGPEVKALPHYITPVVPMVVDDWQNFHAEISRGTQVQQVGYLTWHGRGPNNSERDKAAWNQAVKALHGLVEWSHAIKSSKYWNWQQVANPNSVCGQ